MLSEEEASANPTYIVNDVFEEGGVLSNYPNGFIRHLARSTVCDVDGSLNVI